jgi:hypothetical protein
MPPGKSKSRMGATTGSATRSEMRTMMSSSTSRPLFEVNRSLMSSGVVLACVGFFLWLIGAALSGTALAQAAMKWIDQLEESPSEMARRRAHQFKEAVSAGSKAWREQSH